MQYLKKLLCLSLSFPQHSVIGLETFFKVVNCFPNFSVFFFKFNAKYTSKKPYKSISLKEFTSFKQYQRDSYQAGQCYGILTQGRQPAKISV